MALSSTCSEHGGAGGTARCPGRSFLHAIHHIDDEHLRKGASPSPGAALFIPQSSRFRISRGGPTHMSLWIGRSLMCLAAVLMIAACSDAQERALHLRHRRPPLLRPPLPPPLRSPPLQPPHPSRRTALPFIRRSFPIRERPDNHHLHGYYHQCRDLRSL